MTVDTPSGVAAAAADETEPPEAPSVASVRRRFVRASAIGAALAVLLFLWLVTRGTFNLFEWQRVGEFYDQQAHSLLHGHLSVNADYLGIEAFTVNGTSNIYQGPIPAILRLPIVAVAGGALDGRLTQLSMLVAFVVAIVFAVRLHWKARQALRRDAPMTGGEAFLVGLFTFALAGGSSMLFEASRAWVYHEAAIWGAAFALASIDAMVGYVRRPSVGRLAWVAFFAACTLLTRASIGMGPVVGLGLLFVGAVAVRAARRRPRPAARGRSWWGLVTWLAPGAAEAPDVPDAPDAPDAPPAGRATSPWVLAAGAAIPLAAYAFVNYLKFERLFSIPFSGQRFSEIDPARQEFLRINGGTMFGLQFVPTTVLQYIRPDAIRFTGHFPFVDFTSFPGPIIGNATFDLIDRSSSVPTAMPLLTILTIIGLVALFRPRAWRGSAGLASLRVPMLAAGAAAVTIMPFGYIANRYLTDFIPLLVLGGALGLHTLMPYVTGRDARPWAKGALAGIVALAVIGTWFNLGLALNYQRLWSYNLHPPVVAGYLGLQNDLGGLGTVVQVGAGNPLPDAIGKPGLLAIVGDCDGLYLSDGLPLNVVKTSPWNAVEQTQAAGHFDLDVTFPERPAGTRVPILTFGDSSGILFAEYTDDGRVFLEYHEPDRDLVVRGLPRGYEHGTSYHLDVRADPNLDLMVVTRDDIVMLDAFYNYKGDDYRVGTNTTTADVSEKFPGRIERRRVSAPLCRKLLRDAHAQ
ncbi:MAG: hypothetical protein WDA60_11790 [Acidimicrobiia bacterium]